MECREARELMLDLDNNTQVPPDLAEHVRHCAVCHDEFAVLVSAVRSLELNRADSTDAELTNRVMQAVRLESERPPPASLRTWFIAGTFILGGLLGLRFSDVMTWLRASFGPFLDVTVSVILGLCLTGYICILVGTNLQRLMKILRIR